MTAAASADASRCSGSRRTTSSITPRVVYQKIRAGGFNREEVLQPLRQPVQHGDDLIGERKQYLLLREKFKDDTLLADLTGSIDFGGVELTSITSYINRDILVSRDASALTGSVTVAFGIPGLRRDLPSNLRDTTDLKTFDAGTPPRFDGQRTVPVGLRRLLFRHRARLRAAAANAGL